MIGLFLLLIPVAALNVPLLLYLCRTFDVRSFWKIFALEWGLYAANALLVAMVFGALSLSDMEADLGLLQGVLFMAGFGMVLFALPFAVLFFFLARWVEGRLQQADA